jgi:hypothetical protein
LAEEVAANGMAPLATSVGGSPDGPSSSLTPLAAEAGRAIRETADRLYPLTGGAVPFAMPQRDRLRRQAHELIDALLVTFRQATDEQGAHYIDQVPLVQCSAAVAAGARATATLRVVNDEQTPAEVALYSTNFIADGGYEIPSLRVTATPRCATIAAKGEATFEVSVAVEQQTPAGSYSGLIQAMGCKYVKAVLVVEVL